MLRLIVPAIVLVLAASACRRSSERPETTTSKTTRENSAQLEEHSPEGTFWLWFQRNDDRLFEFEQDRAKVFDDLAHALREVHPDLTFEFGPLSEGRRQFVISAGGIREAFPAVRRLVAAAHASSRWIVVAFRPRRDEVSDIDLNGVHVRANDVSFQAEPDGDRIGVTVFIPDYRPTPEKTFEQIGYLLLDQALGELTVETRIGVVTIGPSTKQTSPKARPLRELARTIDHWPTQH
jgi:hypothetical protein